VELFKEIMSAKHFLDVPNKNLKHIKNKEFLKKIFDVVYSKSSNKTDAETIIKGILRESWGIPVKSATIPL